MTVKSTVSTVATTSNFAKSTSKDWIKEPDVYTGDHLIDAYLQGKEAGRNEHMAILFSKFSENLQTATSISEKLLQDLDKLSIDAKTIHLKADSISNFYSLIIVDDKDFVDDKFRQAYTLARKTKKESETDNFYLTFSFMPASKNLNESCIKADGFFMKYDKK